LALNNSQNHRQKGYATQEYGQHQICKDKLFTQFKERRKLSRNIEDLEEQEYPLTVSVILIKSVLRSGYSGLKSGFVFKYTRISSACVHGDCPIVICTLWRFRKRKLKKKTLGMQQVRVSYFSLISAKEIDYIWLVPKEIVEGWCLYRDYQSYMLTEDRPIALDLHHDVIFWLIND